MNNPNFEEGIVKIQNGNEDSLTRDEKSAVKIFLIQANKKDENEEEMKESIAEQF